MFGRSPANATPMSSVRQSSIVSSAAATSGRRSSRGTADRTGIEGTRVEKRGMRNRKPGGRTAHEHRNRMLARRPRHACCDERRLRVENLRLGGDDVRLGGCSGVVLILGDRERALVLDDRLAEQILERVRLPQRHIGEGERRLRDKQRVGEIGGACLPRPPAAPRSRASQVPRRRASIGRSLRPCESSSSANCGKTLDGCH